MVRSLLRLKEHEVLPECMEMTDLATRMMRELYHAIDRAKRPSHEFDVSEREGWVTVEHRGRRRHYPLTREIGVLLSGDLRRGAFD